MLINCIAYQYGKKVADIPVREIGTYLQRPDCFVWVALKDATPEELSELQAEFHLHELAVEDALRGHQRPKLEEYGDSIFAVMKLIEVEDGELNEGEIAVFVGVNYVLSVRSRSPQQFVGVRDRCEREPHLLRHGPAFVLYALMDAVVDRYFPIAEDLEDRLEALEEGIFTKGAVRDNIEALYALKEKLMTMKHAIAPLMEAAGKLFGGRVPALCANTQDYFRDVYDHLMRLNSLVDNLRDTISSAMQVNLAFVTIEHTETTRRLAAWAAIFAVATAFAGIWGMNFESMPELSWEWGYPVALWIIVAACVVLYWRFKKSGWL